MILDTETLKVIHERAAHYDASNTFPYEDHELLKQRGYYKAFVPKEYGGLGWSLKEIANAQTQLAMAAPATALGINMHHIIVGLGKYMVEHGNMAGEQILRDAVNGELLAFGISEPANDRVLFGSICDAKKQKDGGYTFSGPKVFISMVEACTRLVTYAQDNDQETPQSVFAYIEKNTETMDIDPRWDTLGMRATQSQNMTLKDAYARPDQILAVIDPKNMKDPVVFGIFAYFEILLAATYHGIGKRAVELGVETVSKRKSVANNTTYDQDKNIRWRIAEAAIVLDGVALQIDKVCEDFEAGVDCPFWMPRFSALKNSSVEASKRAVDEIVRASGGSSYSNTQELSRLLRDVYAGLFQPSDQESLHDAWAMMLCGPLR